MQKWLIVIGCVLILVGVLFPWLVKLGVGRLPGDILIKKGNVTFYFPIVTSIILSIVISLIFWLLNK